MGKKSTVAGITFKSNWERRIAADLKKFKIPLQYEVDKLQYIVPASNHTYKPDFKLPSGNYIEAKGIFDRKDREKILLIKERYPKIKIFLAFQNARQKIYKSSKTTYADWCDKHGIEWSHGGLKKEWLND